MKDPRKLQDKLWSLTRGRPGLSLGSSKPPWDAQTFREKFWIVQDYVNNSGDVTNEDPLQEWVEEALFFFSAQHK